MDLDADLEEVGVGRVAGAQLGGVEGAVGAVAPYSVETPRPRRGRACTRVAKSGTPGGVPILARAGNGVVRRRGARPGRRVGLSFGAGPGGPMTGGGAGRRGGLSFGADRGAVLPGRSCRRRLSAGCQGGRRRREVSSGRGGRGRRTGRRRRRAGRWRSSGGVVRVEAPEDARGAHVLAVAGEQREHLDAGGPGRVGVVLVVLLLAGEGVEDAVGEAAVAGVRLGVGEGRGRGRGSWRRRPGR
jgi:hypothetical protein